MSLCKTSDLLGGAIFWPQGYNVNNLGKGPLDLIKYQMSKPRPSSFILEYSWSFAQTSLCKTSDLWDRESFNPRAIYQIV